MKMVAKYGVKELLIVVGDYEDLGSQRDVDFAVPSLKRRHAKNSITESEKQEWEAMPLQKTGDKIRRELRKVMQKVKEERDAEEYSYELEDWGIPKIKFVEVRAGSRD